MQSPQMQMLPQMTLYHPPAIPQPMTPTYAGSPAFGAPLGPPLMVLQTSAAQPVSNPASNREPSGSRLPPVPNVDLTGRSPGEQAVIVALQAVANYPDHNEFIHAVGQRIPGLAEYLQNAAAQPSGCEPANVTARSQTEAVSMEETAMAGPSGSAVAGPSEESGRKRLPREPAATASTSTVVDSPTSRPPPDKREDVPQNEERGNSQTHVPSRSPGSWSTADVIRRSLRTLWRL